MDDLATLGIKIDFAQVREAISLLDQLAERGPKVEGSVKKIGDSARQTATGFDLLKTAAVGLFGAFSIKMLADVSSEFSDLRGRVNDAAGSLEKGGAVMDRIAAISRTTYASLGQTAEGYLANASSMRELGYSTQQVLDYTSALNNAMTISGAKGETALQVQTALAKAMSLGALRGEELNTVIAKGGVVTDLLTTHFDTNREGLLKLGAEGKLTGDIIAKILIKAMEDLETRSGNMSATINDGLTQMGNAIMLLVGKWDALTGAGETLGNGLVWVADNLEQLVVIGGTATALYGGSMVAAFGLSRLAAVGLAGALKAVAGALVTTGIGAIAVALGQLVYMLIQAREASEDWGEAFQKVVGRMEPLMAGVRAAFLGLTDGMKAAWLLAMAEILRATQATFGPIAQLIGLTFGGFDEAISNLKKDAADFGAFAGIQFEFAGEKFKEGFADFGIDNKPVVDLTDKLSRLNVAANDNSKAAAKLKKAWDDLLRTAKDRVAQMELEAQLVGKNAIEADVLRLKLEALQEAEKKGLKLKPEQIAQLDALAEKYGQLATKVAEYQLMEDAAFERQQMFRSPIDQRIASDLKQAGIEMDSAGGQAYATFVKTTEQIGIAKDAVRDFAGTFVSDLLAGKSAMDALIGALGKLGDKLIQMALDEAINGLFKNLLGVVGGGLFGGGGGGWNSSLTSQVGQGSIGLFATGGISDKPAIFGEAGPEAAVPLPDGRSIPVTLSGSTGVSGGYVDNRVYNFQGTGDEVAAFRAEVARMDREIDARAVNAVRQAEQENYKFGT